MGMDKAEIQKIFDNQKAYFNTGATLSYKSRVKNLKHFYTTIDENLEKIHEALFKDLGKGAFESTLSETGITLHDISLTLNKLKKWMKPRKVSTSVLIQPGKSKITPKPLGVNLIIAPYNYPVQLTLMPITAALAAGNTVIVKASELSPATDAVLGELINKHFDPNLVAYIPGAIPETTSLLELPFDHIFFTGSPRVGSIVMQAAAKNLSPVTLELGGKSPLIVDKHCNVKLAAKRAVWGKIVNTGQTCIAPDYALIHEDIKEEFYKHAKHYAATFYGEDVEKSADYGRIINDNHFKRIASMITDEHILFGGQTNPNTRFIAPTFLKDVDLNHPAMQEEIFGPLLPCVAYKEEKEIYEVIAKQPHHPLALYIFSEDKGFQNRILDNTQSGGVSINHTLLHLVNGNLPFGGVGQSGIGAYHGIHGFERFSHMRAVYEASSKVDLPMLYPPYKDFTLKILNKLMR